MLHRMSNLTNGWVRKHDRRSTVQAVKGMRIHVALACSIYIATALLPPHLGLLRHHFRGVTISLRDHRKQCPCCRYQTLGVPDGHAMSLLTAVPGPAIGLNVLSVLSPIAQWLARYSEPLPVIGLDGLPQSRKSPMEEPLRPDSGLARHGGSGGIPRGSLLGLMCLAS